jgi:flagellar hook assembly protein FlgD
MAAARAVGFHYETSAPGSVRLDVFDKLGRRVWSAEEKQLPAGQHVTLWNGRCVDGTPASAGIYFCRLSATGIEETCSFMLLSKDKRRL